MEELRKKSNRVLSIHGYFELPQDFQGSASEALRLLALHLENPELKKNCSPAKHLKPHNEITIRDLWSYHLNSNYFFNGLMSISKIMNEGEYEKIDMKIP